MRIDLFSVGTQQGMDAFRLNGYILLPDLYEFQFHTCKIIQIVKNIIKSLLTGELFTEPDRFVNHMGTRPVLIHKAPRIFAAWIGFLLTSLTALAALAGFPLLASVAGAVLVLFAFLECGLNFCAGCWVYTYMVYPLVRKNL
jgi:hypothetical protein